MSSLSRYKIIQEKLDVSYSLMGQMVKGTRGGRDMEKTEKVIKAVKKADKLYEDFNIGLMQFCEDLNKPCGEEMDGE
jgi:hypothetical protein